MLFCRTKCYSFIPPCIAVLTTLVDDDGPNKLNVSVTIGEPANFSCTVSDGDTNFTIIWKIGGQEYYCDDEPEIGADIECEMNDHVSMLYIQSTSLFGVGIHEVQCIFQPNIHPNYANDPSFLLEFNENTTKTKTLEILNSYTTSKLMLK